LSQFEFVAVFISIVLGLGVTHLLLGFGETIQERKSLEPYWVHTVWSINVLHYHLSIWWNYFVWGELESWSYGLFLVLIGYAVLLFLMAVVLYPRRLEPGFDFKEHLLENRVWFFSLLTAAGFVDVAETWLKQAAGIRPIPEGYAVYGVVLTGSAVACLLTRNTRVMAAAAVIWLAVDLYFNGTAVGALGDLFEP
jgi:hypothetical protein